MADKQDGGASPLVLISFAGCFSGPEMTDDRG